MKKHLVVTAVAKAITAGAWGVGLLDSDAALDGVFDVLPTAAASKKVGLADDVSTIYKRVWDKDTKSVFKTPAERDEKFTEYIQYLLSTESKTQANLQTLATKVKGGRNDAYISEKYAAACYAISVELATLPGIKSKIKIDTAALKKAFDTLMEDAKQYGNSEGRKSELKKSAKELGIKL